MVNIISSAGARAAFNGLRDLFDTSFEVRPIT